MQQNVDTHFVTKQRYAGKKFSFDEIIWLITLMLAPLDSALILPLKISGFNLSLFRVFLGLAIISTILKICIKGNIHTFSGCYVALLPFFLWIIWNVASLLWTVNIDPSKRYILLLATNSVLMLAIPWMSQSVLKYNSILQCILAILYIALFFGLVEAVTGFRISAQRILAFRNEITSFFINPLHFAASLVMFSSFFVQYLMERPGKFWKHIFSLVVIGLIVYFLIRTGSRTGLIAFMFVLALSGLFSMRSLVSGLKWGGAFLVICLSTVLVLKVFYQSIPMDILNKLHALEKLFIPGEKFFVGSDRLTLISMGAMFWMDAPLIGWGSGSVEYLLESIGGLGGVYSLHNWGMEVLVNTGLVGFSLFLIFYLIVLVGLFKLTKRKAGVHISYLAKSLFIGMASLIPLSFGVSSVMTLPLFWIYMGLSLGLMKVSRYRCCQDQ